MHFSAGAFNQGCVIGADEAVCFGRQVSRGKSLQNGRTEVFEPATAIPVVACLLTMPSRTVLMVSLTGTATSAPSWSLAVSYRFLQHSFSYQRSDAVVNQDDIIIRNVLSHGIQAIHNGILSLPCRREQLLQSF